jgi:RNA polymerase sigma factor (TIGR02999 family)
VAADFDPSPGEVTRLLGAWSSGDQQALNGLMPLVYAELHRIARRAWSNQDSGHTLQPTALIHEAYLKLIQTESGFQGRKHFFAVASIAMRHILVNHAMANLTAKRGSGKVNVSLDEAEPVVSTESEQVVALHEALETLHAIDPRKSRVVELRYFAGLSIEETAEVLGVSAITVNRDWRLARTWLMREMNRAS